MNSAGLAATIPWSAVALFAFATSITPGPNNLMLLSSGARFGLRRTLPHLLGIPLGAAALLVLSCAGIGALLLAWPAGALALKVFGAGYLLYLTWKLLKNRNAETADADAAAQPLKLREAALFQFVNPKAWMMSIAAAASAAGASLPDTALLVLMFVAINLPCIAVWAALGVALVRLLRTPASRNLFNIVIALLLGASALMMLAA